MTPSDMLTIVSIISSAVSAILALGAIALAVYFYTQSKNTETKVSSALESIKAQAEALQRLTGRHMDRLIKGVTEARPADETLIYMIQAIKEIPTSITSQLQGASTSATNQTLVNEAVTCYIATYYYTGITNIAVQGLLPSLSDLQPDDTIKRIVDQSCADFRLLEGILARADSILVSSNRLYHLYNEALTQWKPFVKDSTTVYKEREETGLNI